MKKLALAVLFALVAVFPINLGSADFIVPGSQNIVAQAQEKILLALMPVEEMRPVHRVIRRGDRLWDYARDYGLGKPSEIVDFNKGKPGEKCIENENLIYALCEIAIPIYTLPQVQVQHGINEKIFEAQKQKAETAQNLTRQNKQLSFALVALVVILSGALYFAIITGLADKQKFKEFSQKNQDLSKQLWEANDQCEALKTEFTHVRVKLDLANQKLAAKEGVNEAFNQASLLLEEKEESLKNAEARVSELESFLEAERASNSSAFSPDSEQTVSLKERDVKFKVKMTFECQECNAKDINPKNAKSHASQQHGDTTEHKWPD